MDARNMPTMAELKGSERGSNPTNVPLLEKKKKTKKSLCPKVEEPVA